jgi:hypothetical protein
MVVKHTRRLKNKKSVKTIKINTRGKSVKSIRRKIQRGGVDGSKIEPNNNEPNNNGTYNELIYDLASPLIEPNAEANPDNKQVEFENSLSNAIDVQFRSNSILHNTENSKGFEEIVTQYPEKPELTPENIKIIEKYNTKEIFTRYSGIHLLRLNQNEYLSNIINANAKRDVNPNEIFKFNNKIYTALESLKSRLKLLPPDYKTYLTKINNFYGTKLGKELFHNFILSHIKFPENSDYSEHELNFYIFKELLIHKDPINIYLFNVSLSIKTLEDYINDLNPNLTNPKKTKKAKTNSPKVKIETMEELIGQLGRFSTKSFFKDYITTVSTKLDFPLLRNYLLSVNGISPKY